MLKKATTAATSGTIKSTSSSLANRMAALDLAGSSKKASVGATSVSAGARRLLKAQEAKLAKIIADVKSAGIEKYVKHDHWAWYVWPTTKEGMSDSAQVAVKNAEDVAFVLAAPTCAAWTECLDILAQAVRSRKNGKRVFPSIDHGRIDFFIQEWSASDYQEAMKAQPEFAAAFEAFFSAWKEAGSSEPKIPNPWARY